MSYDKYVYGSFMIFFHKQLNHKSLLFLSVYHHFIKFYINTDFSHDVMSVCDKMPYIKIDIKLNI